MRAEKNPVFSYEFKPFLPDLIATLSEPSTTPIMLASVAVEDKTVNEEDNNEFIVKIRKKAPSKKYKLLKTENSKPVEYTVKRGDCLSRIAHYYGVSTKSLIYKNKLHSNKIFKGQRLIIPLSSSVDLIRRQNKSQMLWPLPMRGRISSPFGMRIHPITHLRSFHRGIDLPAPKNTPIRAVNSGKVYFSGYRYLSGRMVILKHPNGLMSIYAHCNKLYVKKGQWVKQGQKIATVGLTGRTTGYHLHFGVKKGNTYLNPLKYLK